MTMVQPADNAADESGRKDGGIKRNCESKTGKAAFKGVGETEAESGLRSGLRSVVGSELGLRVKAAFGGAGEDECGLTCSKLYGAKVRASRRIVDEKSAAVHP